MSTERKAAHRCAVCGQFMKLKRVIPRAHIFPEMKTFQCLGCGSFRTVEDDGELLQPSAVAQAGKKPVRVVVSNRPDIDRIL